MHTLSTRIRTRRHLAVCCTRPLALLLTLAVALAGLHVSAPVGRAAAQGPRDDADTPDMPSGYPSDDAIDWQPCPENAALECGTLTLPVDYRRPYGETFAMAVIRARALQASRRIGVLFAHPGIHLPGVDFVLSSVNVPAFNRIRQRFDIVSLDPRGAGRTRKLDCGLDLPAPPTDQSEAALIAYLDDYGRRVATQCLDQERDFVLSISSNNFARDIEMLRRALGERYLNFGMISNSGPVAAVYATLFPRRVRAMLIDSTVAPEFRDYAIERWSEEAAGYALALRRLDQLCRHEAGCPLRDTGVIAAFDTVFARLQAAPATLPNGSPFTARDLSEVFFNLLPIEPLWPRIPAALAQALAGDFTGLAPFRSPPSMAGDSLIARSCNDYGTRRTAADYLPMVAAVSETYPRIFGRLELASFIALCSAWPAADPPLIRNVRHRLRVPILLIGSEFDPAAPLAWSKRLAQALGMEERVVRYQGGGHGLAQRSDIPCISEVIEAYLFELRLPPADYACPAVPLAPGAR